MEDNFNPKNFEELRKNLYQQESIYYLYRNIEGLNITIVFYNLNCYTFKKYYWGHYQSFFSMKEDAKYWLKSGNRRAFNIIQIINFLEEK